MDFLREAAQEIVMHRPQMLLCTVVILGIATCTSLAPLNEAGSRRLSGSESTWFATGEKWKLRTGK
jgi:hypothetical protein